jgi:hypothetical protein
LRLFKDYLSEVEAFDYKCEAFIKVTRLFEDIFNGNEAFLNYFQRNGGFFYSCGTF